MALTCLAASFANAGGREITSTSVRTRLRTYHPAPHWLGGITGGACTIDVRLNNLSKVQQNIQITFDDLRTAFGILMRQPPGGMSGWTNTPAGAGGWFGLSLNPSPIVKTMVLNSGERRSEKITLRCAAKKNASGSCAIDPTTLPTSDIGSTSAWSGGLVDCDKNDVVCGAHVDLETAIKVTVAEDRGAVTGRVIGSCTINNGADHLIVENEDQVLNAGRPF